MVFILILMGLLQNKAGASALTIQSGKVQYLFKLSCSKPAPTPKENNLMQLGYCDYDLFTVVDDKNVEHTYKIKDVINRTISEMKGLEVK